MLNERNACMIWKLVGIYPPWIRVSSHKGWKLKRMHKQQDIQQQVEANNRLQIPSGKIQCSIAT
jgi:hypothetical protein